MTLREKLQTAGIEDMPSPYPSKRVLIQDGNLLGHYSAFEAFDLLKELSK